MEANWKAIGAERKIVSAVGATLAVFAQNRRDSDATVSDLDVDSFHKPDSLFSIFLLLV